MQLPPWAVPGEYDKRPHVSVDSSHAMWRGEETWLELDRFARATSMSAPVIVIDTYPGSDIPGLIAAVTESLPGYEIVNVEETCGKSPDEVEAMVAHHLTDDRVFGVMSHFTVADFYELGSLETLASRIQHSDRPTVVIGLGATLLPVAADCLVLADMARWEIQQRQRGGAPNWLATNGHEDNLRKFKRGYFVDWRVADRHKREWLGKYDYVLDANQTAAPAKLIRGETLRAGLKAASSQPIRVVPFFDPGVWGGMWMKELCELEDTASNYAWCFDCVPEENSLLLRVAGEDFEIPAMDLVLNRPRELLGEEVFARFGAEFPIRFDFLDTMGGQNLSLQVHPLTDYIYQQFGMSYTQDESYYILDAGDNAEVYLGLRDDVVRAEFEDDLRRGAGGVASFPAERHINTFPAKRHDHFLIPAGTAHCSGANSMVLEISATPYIFTFKMWDWDRVGLDGVPRPIHLDHALKNIQWDRTTQWVSEELVDRVEEVDAGPGWREERTGLHELEFIETRRHWFTGPVSHDTYGTVNVLNLVQGRRAVVESPSGAFEPFEVHYAETFIVPASVGPYVIRPAEGNSGELATLKAFVRGTQTTMSSHAPSGRVG
jgi:mannose-6-phosphate isomerase class I